MILFKKKNEITKEKVGTGSHFNMKVVLWVHAVTRSH